MKNEISVVFTGDIGFDKYMDKKWEDEELISKELLHFFYSADHTVANVEGPMVGDDAVYENRLLSHSMSKEASVVLRRIKADFWNICNNHIFDCGSMGIAETIKEAEKCNARAFGAGKNIYDAAAPVYIEGAGGIGMFSVGYRRGCKGATQNDPGCLNWNETDIIRENIKKIKEKCRWCVIVSHGGEEFTSLPMPYTRQRYLSFLEMGADAVVCHHPHVPMNYEKTGGKYIFYSLGNFIFDTDYQRAQFNTEKGVLLKLIFTENEIKFDAVGVKIDRECEKIKKSELPDIFTSVPETEYNLLLPLAAKAFVEATKRQCVFMRPDEFKDATDKKWEEEFLNPKRSGRVQGEALDFFIVCPLAEKYENGEWKKSSLEKVKKYISEQI